MPSPRTILWQLVGHAEVRGCSMDSAGHSTGSLKEVISRQLSIAPRWLVVSWRGRGLECDEAVPKPADRTPLLISLMLPHFALPCAEAWVPRCKRHRVTNQAAVAATAWQTHLLDHERADESEREGDAAERRPAVCYPVFVSGLAGFPAPLLRLNLGCEEPMLSTLRQRLHEVTGMDIELTFAGCVLQGERKYLRRLGVPSGSVVNVQGASTSAGTWGAFDPSPTPHGGDDEVLARQWSYFDESDGCASDSPSGRKCKRTSREHDREGGGAVRLSWNEGAVWAGSSRKKAMSTGSCGPRGPGGQLSALASQPITLKAHADRVECPPERRGGFMPGSSSAA
ncbi:MAG: hypothetical protein ACPIOQ_17815 [Promethearchaeia archaeon]